MALLLRLFADCVTDSQAITIMNAVSAKLSAFSVTVTMTPQQYWKIPAYFEFCFALLPDNAATLTQILAYTDSWLILEDSAIWNRSANSLFLLSEVAWAEVIFPLNSKPLI